MDLETPTDEEGVFENPGISGGYIVSERPLFLRSSVICVVNNRKCVLYDSRAARKLCETYLNREMIVSSRAFVYEDEYEVLLCASSNGFVAVYHVPPGLTSRPDGEASAQAPLDLVAELRIECKNLLAMEVARESGEVLCLVLTEDLKTEILRLALDYDALLFANDAEGGDVKDHAVMKIRVSEPAEVNHVETEGVSVPGGKRPWRALERLASLESKLEVFEADANGHWVAVAEKKSCLLLDLRTRDVFYLENENVITCIAFGPKGTLTLGGLGGQISVVSPFNKGTPLGSGPQGPNSPGIPVISFKLGALPLELPRLASYLRAGSIPNYTPHGELPKSVSTARAEVKKLHWHAHGVNCLCYDRDVLISGGEEGVVVFWDPATQAKKFVTRLGAPIFHLCARDGLVSAALQNNSIVLIDATSLSVTAKISSLYVDPGLGDLDGPNRLVRCYPEPTDLALGPLDPRSPGFAGGFGTTSGGSVVVAGTDKLQVYDYLRDMEMRQIDVSFVNYVSRQEEDFGRKYRVTSICLSRDCRFVLVAQSRPRISASNERDGFGREGDKAHVLKFYQMRQVHSRPGPKGVESEARTGGPNCVIHTTIYDPHEGDITALTQLQQKTEFVSASTDGKLNLYRLVQLGTGTSSEAGGETLLNQTQRDTWVCAQVVDYKAMPIHALALNANDLMVLLHDSVLSLWKYLEGPEAGLVPLKSMTTNTPTELIYVSFFDNEKVIFADRAAVYKYDFKLGTRSVVYSTGDQDEEITQVHFRSGLLAVNVKRRLSNGLWSSVIEVYGDSGVKVYSKVIPGSEHLLDVRLVPCQTQLPRSGHSQPKKESLTEPLLKEVDARHSLLVINFRTYDIELLPLQSPTGGSLPLPSGAFSPVAGSDKPAPRKIPRRDRQFDVVSKFILDLMDRSKAGTRSKQRHNLCARHYKGGPLVIKPDFLESLYASSSTALPTPNAVIHSLVSSQVPRPNL